jgi:hypothetical protein
MGPKKQVKRKAKEEEEDSEQKIEKILEVRPIKRKREFRVKLKGISCRSTFPCNLTRYRSIGRSLAARGTSWLNSHQGMQKIQVVANQRKGVRSTNQKRQRRSQRTLP